MIFYYIVIMLLCMINIWGLYYGSLENKNYILK